MVRKQKARQKAGEVKARRILFLGGTQDRKQAA